MHSSFKPKSSTRTLSHCCVYIWHDDMIRRAGKKRTPSFCWTIGAPAKISVEAPHTRLCVYSWTTPQTCRPFDMNLTSLQNHCVYFLYRTSIVLADTPPTHTHTYPHTHTYTHTPTHTHTQLQGLSDINRRYKDMFPEDDTKLKPLVAGLSNRCAVSPQHKRIPRLSVALQR